MILYTNKDDVRKYVDQSFIIRKLKEKNRFWNFKVFTDHMGLRDRLVLLNTIRKRADFICYSVESSIHGLKYWRPYRFSTFNITHKKLNKKTTLWFSAFADEYLSEWQINPEPAKLKSSKILLITSNFNKIKELEIKMGPDFDDLDFYGLFSKPIPPSSKPSEVWKNYHQDSQKMMARYDATLALDNSYEDGYIQGNWMRAIRAKSVPIITASEAVKKRVLDRRAFIDFDNFMKMTNAERKKNILKVKDFLYSEPQVLSNLILDYLSFMKEMSFSDLDKLIEKSNFYRDKVFPE